MATRTTEQIALPIKGMTCASCVSHVTHALEEVPGVDEASVNLATEKAIVELDPERVTPSVLADALDDAGYGVDVDKVTLNIGGMTWQKPISVDASTKLSHVRTIIRGQIYRPWQGQRP